MIYNLENGILNKDCLESLLKKEDKNFFGIIKLDEFKSVGEKIGISEKVISESLSFRTSKFESYDGYDYITLIIASVQNALNEPKRISIYFTKSMLLFICSDSHIITSYLEGILEGGHKCPSLAKLLDIFLDRLTVGDTYAIESIEQEIAELEEGLITSINSDYLKNIIILRKKLLNLKRYYEQFYNVAEGIEENENGLIDKKTIKSFRILTSRVNRLYQGVINLRDYVTQVREAYQAQIDINQNRLMKVFTVVTSIFLPLTLIVGWYGMNLKMPEFNWNYGYLFVIMISVLVVIVITIVFKKKKWL